MSESASRSNGVAEPLLPHNWQELAPLVDAVLDVPPEQRAAVLTQVSAGDQERRAELARLVAECERDVPLLNRPAPERFSRLLEEEAVRVPASLAERYPVTRELGRGGMAVVYLARDLKHGRDVAVKIVRQEFAAALGRERFLREIAVAAQLHHPHIVPLYDSGEADGVLYYVMPYEDGPSLRARLSEEGALPVSDAMSILRDIARALAYAHGHGVVHRDIKPDNVLLSGGSAMVTDFGIAKAVTAASSDATRAGLTQTGLGIGTPAYMAPEQVTGDPGTDHRADIYSFGCLAYELFTGKPPFHGLPSHQVAAAHLGTTPRPVSELRAETPEAVAALIGRCLAKDPAQRPQSARELLPALDGVATPPNVTVRRRTPVAVLIAAGLAAVAVVVLVAGYFVIRGGRLPTIAVLPFTNVGDDSTNLPYSDGIADELTTALGRSEGLEVIARTSASKLKDEGLDARGIGQKLQVRYVVEGSIQRAEKRRRVRAALIDVASGKELWSDNFEHDALNRDVFAVQDSITRSIMRQLLPRIARATIASSVTRSTASPEAHDLYLQGRFFLEKRGPANLAKAQNYFERAIEKDPSYALAYAGLSETYSQQAITGESAPSDIFPKAKEYAAQALALDSMLAEVHTALAFIALWYDWDWAVAGREFETALKLNPGYSPAHRFHAFYYLATDSVSEAIAEGRLAVRLDPFSSLSNTRLVSLLYHVGRYPEALDQARKTSELDSNIVNLRNEFLRVYAALGRCQDAMYKLDSLAALPRTPDLQGTWGFVYAKCDRRPQALAELGRFRAQARAGKYVSHYTLAAIEAGLGNKEQAFAELDSAYTERVWRMFLLKREPMFKDLRSDPRFAVLVKKVGLVP